MRRRSRVILASPGAEQARRAESVATLAPQQQRARQPHSQIAPRRSRPPPSCLRDRAPSGRAAARRQRRPRRQRRECCRSRRRRWWRQPAATAAMPRAAAAASESSRSQPVSPCVAVAQASGASTAAAAALRLQPTVSQPRAARATAAARARAMRLMPGRSPRMARLFFIHYIHLVVVHPRCGGCSLWG